MYIVIDDTYGPNQATGSRNITENRKTSVALIFPDSEVAQYRSEISGCLNEVNKLLPQPANEFHFSDIYHRRGYWKALPDGANISLFEFFASIYASYRWPVFIQTIDERTFRDHGIKGFEGTIEGIDISSRAALSLLFLLIKIKSHYQSSQEPIHLLIDEGLKCDGTTYGNAVFHDWLHPVEGKFCSSSSEPLLQLVDFIAFCINRSTYLATKKNRSDFDNYFLNLIGQMGINSEDIMFAKLPQDFDVSDFDALHDLDRSKKGLNKL